VTTERNLDQPRPHGLVLYNSFVLTAVLIGALCHGASCAADNVSLEDFQFQIGRTSYHAAARRAQRRRFQIDRFGRS